MKPWHSAFALTLEDRYVAQHTGDEFRQWIGQQPSADSAWQNCPRGDWLLWLLQLADADRTLVVELALPPIKAGLTLVPKLEEYGQVSDALQSLEEYAKRTPWIFDDLEDYVEVECSRIGDRILDLLDTLSGPPSIAVDALSDLITAPGDIAAAPNALKGVADAMRASGWSAQEIEKHTTDTIRARRSAKAEVVDYCAAS